MIPRPSRNGRVRCGACQTCLSIADEDSRDVAVLKRAALQRMALDYRRRDDVGFVGKQPLEAKVLRDKMQ